MIEKGCPAKLPPGPRFARLPLAVAFPLKPATTLGFLARRYGPLFTVTLPLLGRTVVITEPEKISELLHQPAEIVGGMEPNLSVVLGPGSIFGLQSAEHRRRRKLITPPFHGENLRSFEEIIETETRKEIATWPTGTEYSTIESFNRITLNVILRAMFGADGDDFDQLREWMPKWIKFGSALFPFTWLHRDWGPLSPWGRHLANRRKFDTIVDRLCVKAKADPAFEERRDVLSLMLRSRYDDGTAMSRADIGDELLSLLIAGHETTSTALAWAMERLRRHPVLIARLQNEIEAQDALLLQATIHEVLRTRPILVGTPRKVEAESMQLGEWIIPRGTKLYIATCVTHNDDRNFTDAARFDPDRFVGAMPNIYAWTPYGGGIRRCLGAAFANMEMTVVLRTILQTLELVPTTEADEKVAFRGVAYAPSKGGRVVVRRRLATKAGMNR
ncbi:cytochrome P450 [Mycobacteroides abscessus]|uniref:cytochrome P450 n=1 Tax=Mycobacteroides abscessus TaxID=36809 RepID=UPI000C258345|nr:cytochrome P450 [Mycobacteroides abscessus]